MAHDEALASRFRDGLEGQTGTSEKKMMGAMCFFLHGNMIGGADRNKDGQGRFMFRVGKDNAAEALTRKGARIAEIGGRRMGGFIFVHEEDCDEDELKDWIALALSFVSTLPSK